MNKLAPLAALVATLSAPLLARADASAPAPDGGAAPGMTAPLTAPAQPASVASTTSSTASPKSEDIALELSLGGTATSAALVLIGARTGSGAMMGTGLLSSLVTPSLGEWYVGKVATPGLGIRAASAVATLIGTAQVFKCIDAEGDCQTPATAPYLLFGGLIGYAGGSLYDIATAPREARRYNESHRLHLTVAPTPLRTPSGQSTMGLGIGGSF